MGLMQTIDTSMSRWGSEVDYTVIASIVAGSFRSWDGSWFISCICVTEVLSIPWSWEDLNTIYSYGRLSLKMDYDQFFTPQSPV